MNRKGKDFFSFFSSGGEGKASQGILKHREREKPSLLWQISGGLFALIPAFVFSLRQDMPHIFLLTAGIVAAGMIFFRKGFRDLERPLIYCTVIALVLTVIPDMMIPPDERRFGFFDMLLRTTLSAPLLLYLSAMGGFFSPTPQIAGARAALALLGMLICGDRFFPGDFQNTHLSFLDPLLKNYYLLYGSGALGMALLIPLCFLSISRFEERKKGSEKRGRGLWVRLFFLLLIPLLAWGGFEIFRQNPELLVRIERFFLGVGGRRTVRNYVKNPLAAYFMSNEVNLRRPFPDLPPEKRKVLLYVKSSSGEELYLRGAVSHFYSRGVWRGNQRTRKERNTLVQWQRMGILSYTTFLLPGLEKWSPETEEALEKKKKELTRVDLYFAGLESGGTVPSPGGVLLMDAVADEGDMDNDGLLFLRYFRKDGGVTLFFPGKEKSYTLPEEPAEGNKELYLGTPRRIREDLQKYLQRIYGEAPAGKKEKISGMSTKEKAGLIRDHLSTLEYTRRFQDPGNSDPVIHFLFRNRKGHCELFNTALVLLLRTAGIPARYVRGFYAGESAPGKVRKIVEGHAWSEVYLEKEKKWIVLDAVPAESRAPEAKGSFWKEEMKNLSFTFREIFAKIRRGYFAESILELLKKLFFCVGVLFRPPVGYMISAMVFPVLFFLYRKKKKRLAEEEKRMGLTPEKRKLLKSMQKWERSFFRSFPGMEKRKKEEDIAGFFLKWAQEKKSCPSAALVKSLVERYIYLRFGKESLTREDVKEFQRELIRFRKEWKKGDSDA